VKVTDDKIVLKGSVPTGNQRAVAERIAQSYAGKRRVDNRLGVSTGDFGTQNSETQPEPQR
jgi:osmotically-inducible protein OsmY